LTTFLKIFATPNQPSAFGPSGKTGAYNLEMTKLCPQIFVIIEPDTPNIQHLKQELAIMVLSTKGNG